MNAFEIADVTHLAGFVQELAEWRRGQNEALQMTQKERERVQREKEMAEKKREEVVN